MYWLKSIAEKYQVVFSNISHDDIYGMSIYYSSMKRSMELLPQVAFSIMLALSLQPRHGYEIMKQVEHDSGGRIKLGPGALYGTLKQLRETGLIEELTAQNESERKRSYRLSHEGWARLNEELGYYKTTVNLARKRVLPEQGV
jgi:DNA-binding PadR family transcriptional regulator